MNTPAAPSADSALLREIAAALPRGLDFLRRRQKPDGEFPCHFHYTGKGRDEWGMDLCIFPTALTADCLISLNDPAATEDMLARATQFLLDEVHFQGLWSHFTRVHGLRHVCVCDVDDTACVSVVLKARGHAAALGPNVRLLLANRNRRGLFYTYIITRLTWNFDRLWWRAALLEWKHPRTNLRYWASLKATTRNTVDAVVNANVLYYLGNIPQMQPVAEYLVRVITSGEETRSDTFYRLPNVIYYFFSRCLPHGIPALEAIRQPMIDRIRATARPDGRLGETALETAMGVCALLNLGVPAAEAAPALRHLIETQQAEGEWPRTELYDGGKTQGIAWGSEELTTAFCLEALGRYRATSQGA